MASPSPSVDPLADGLEAWRAAVETIRQALAEDPSPERRDALRRQLRALYGRVTSTLEEAHRLREAIRQLAEQVHPGSSHPSAGVPAASRAALHADRLGASTYIEKGWHLITQGDAPGAALALRQALALVPNDPQALALLGWAQLLGEAHAEARATFETVLSLEPDNALALVNLGFLDLQAQAFGEAIGRLTRAIRLERDPRATLYAHYYLGLVYLERDMHADAIGFFERALRLAPNLIEARHALGRARWFAGQRDAARQAWAEGAAAGSASPWAARCGQLLALVDAGGEVPRSSRA